MNIKFYRPLVFEVDVCCVGVGDSKRGQVRVSVSLRLGSVAFSFVLLCQGVNRASFAQLTKDTGRTL